MSSKYTNLTLSISSTPNPFEMSRFLAIIYFEYVVCQKYSSYIPYLHHKLRNILPGPFVGALQTQYLQQSSSAIWLITANCGGQFIFGGGKAVIGGQVF